MFSNWDGLTIKDKIVKPLSWAAASSGGSSWLAMKSDARKSALTSSTAISAAFRAFSISSRHTMPGRIWVSSHHSMAPVRSSGFK